VVNADFALFFLGLDGIRIAARMSTLPESSGITFVPPICLLSAVFHTSSVVGSCAARRTLILTGTLVHSPLLRENRDIMHSRSIMVDFPD